MLNFNLPKAAQLLQRPLYSQQICETRLGSSLALHSLCAGKSGSGHSSLPTPQAQHEGLILQMHPQHPRGGRAAEDLYTNTEQGDALPSSDTGLAPTFALSSKAGREDGAARRAVAACVSSGTETLSQGLCPCLWYPPVARSDIATSARPAPCHLQPPPALPLTSPHALPSLCRMLLAASPAAGRKARGWGLTSAQICRANTWCKPSWFGRMVKPRTAGILPSRFQMHRS